MNDRAEQGPRIESDTAPASHQISQTGEVPAVAEPKAWINCREIDDWCRECIQHRPPIISATNGLIGSVSLLVGFVTGLASTNRPGWHAIFLAGIIVSALLAIACLLAMAIPRRRSHNEPPGSLKHLANRMERAKTEGAVKQSAAVPAAITPATALPLEITRAFYGISASKTDVTEVLRNLVVDGQLAMTVDNKTLVGENDPAQGELKTLWVDYLVQGERRTTSFEEKTSIVLP